VKDAPRCCDVCGGEPPAGESLIEEPLPFARRRSYCPSCHAALERRVNRWLNVPLLALALWGAGSALLGRGRLLDSWGAAIMVFLGLQWLMIVPHELGHACAARLLGFRDIRIVVGAGRPLFTCEIFRIPWLFRLLPSGGLTLFNWPATTRGLRWKLLAVCAAGPAFNAVAAGAIWASVESGALFDGTKTLAELLLWANLALFVTALYPCTIRSPLGVLESDGLLIWNTLFRWNRPPRDRAPHYSRKAIFLRRVLVSVLAAVMAFAMLVFGFLVYHTLSLARGAPDLGTWFVVATLLPLMLAAGWMTVRIARQPLPTARPATRKPVAVRAMEEWRARSTWAAAPREVDEFLSHLRRDDLDAALAALDAALARHPGDLMALRFRGELLPPLGRVAEAERAWDELLALAPDRTSASHGEASAWKLQCILEQGDEERAEPLFRSLLEAERSVADTVELVDQVVCTMLFRDPPRHLNRIEGWARRMLERAPGTLSLMGTLGGILAEQGKIDEAEPLLRECRERSTALHDQGFASLYLGIVAMSRGELKLAKTQLKHATILHAHPSIVERAGRMLRECDGDRSQR